MDDIMTMQEAAGMEMPIQQSPWYDQPMSLDDVRNHITANYLTIKRSFIAIGFYLKKADQNSLYLDAGYSSVWNFAHEEYGLDKSRASRYMSINTKFSVGGNSPILQERYKAFNKSQMQEMLYLEDDQLEQVTPDMRVQDIRDIRQPKEKTYSIPYFELDGQMEFGADFPEVMPEQPEQIQAPMPQAQSFVINVSDLLPEEPVAISQQPEPQTMSAQPQVNVARECHYRPGYPCYLTPEQQMTTGAQGACGSSCCWDCQKHGDCKLECYSSGQRPVVTEPISQEPETVVDAAFVEIEEPETETEGLTDLQIAQIELSRANDLLNKCLKSVPETDVHIRGMKIKVAALASLICDMDAIENPPEPVIQPELPLLKNNDQRAAFVDAYETWPLWIETAETGERYYRYDLQDGTSMVVKVYHAMLFDYGKTDCYWKERYTEGYGRQEYYLLKPGRFFRDCEANRSALIDKLKEIQKKG